MACDSKIFIRLSTFLEIKKFLHSIHSQVKYELVTTYLSDLGDLSVKDFSREICLTVSH